MPPMQKVTQYHETAWSQPSCTIPDYYVPPSQSQSPAPPGDPYADISPPSSPPRSNRESFVSVPVSPIESEVGLGSRAPLTSYEYRSRIPRRKVSEKAKQPDPAIKKKQETRWDIYSGEPTKDDSGQLSTVRPGSQPLEFQYPQLKKRTLEILAGLRERDAANKPAWEKQPYPVAPVDTLDHVIHKEPWKGPSGRNALVEPVQNNPSARTGPLQAPQRIVGQVQQASIVERPKSPIHSLKSMYSEESIRPVAPLKIVTKSRNPSPQSSTIGSSPPAFDTIHSAPPVYQTSKMLQSPFASPGNVRDTDTPAPLASARADSPPNDHAPDTPRTPTPPASYQHMTPIKIQQMPDEPEVSRFSWTTYSTSVADSPGNMARIYREESPPPPIPQMPALHIRKRPVSGGFTGGAYTDIEVHTSSPVSTIARKPIGSKPRPSSGAFSQLSLSKTLPQIPPEMEATDKIANLEAQLNALAMRRHNTTRIIRDLNESLKKNAIIYDLWKRRDVTERISNHETELQSINNEAHDVGLLLHRAQRKRDAASNYEVPTGLWIRRVTS